MKKITFTLSLLFCGLLATAQSGLEKIIVEKYYISNGDDSIGGIEFGSLPIGSTTYRVYADMLPGYKFQALYGVPGSPGDSVGKHELRFETTTTFFNNGDRGAKIPDGISLPNTRKNTVRIDSWFSVGAAAQGEIGVLKTEDTDGTIGNSAVPPILQNNDTAAGIPINLGDTAEDGMVVGAPEGVNFVGVSDSALAIFDEGSTVGSLFTTYNGSIASFMGSTGATVSNTVLLGQFTTNGVFSFKLNLQIGAPDGTVENYVAENPVDTNEIMLASLTYVSPVDTTSHDTTHHGDDAVHTIAASNAIVDIYPNPAKDIVTIDISNSKSNTNMYSVYDSRGILVSQKRLGEISNKYSEKIDISSYPQGLYIVVLSLDGKVKSKKIIKN